MLIYMGLLDKVNSDFLRLNLISEDLLNLTLNVSNDSESHGDISLAS